MTKHHIAAAESGFLASLGMTIVANGDCDGANDAIRKCTVTEL
jgi:hypothetical protein